MHFNSETASCTPLMLIIDENDNSPCPRIFIFRSKLKFSIVHSPLKKKSFRHQTQKVVPRIETSSIFAEESASRKTVIAGLKFYLTLSGIVDA